MSLQERADLPERPRPRRAKSERPFAGKKVGDYVMGETADGQTRDGIIVEVKGAGRSVIIDDGR